MRHLIHRQQFDLRLADVAQALDHQQQVRRLWQEKLLPIADAIFTSLTADGTTLRLETLEIDLGNLAISSPEQWETVWRDQLTASLTAQLANAVRTPEKPTQFSALDGLLFFLKTGQAAWWVTENEEFDPIKLLENFLTDQPEALRKVLWNAFNQASDRPNLLERLQHQIPEILRQRILALLSPEVAGFAERGEFFLKAWIFFRELYRLDSSLLASSKPAETLLKIEWERLQWETLFLPESRSKGDFFTEKVLDILLEALPLQPVKAAFLTHLKTQNEAGLLGNWFPWIEKHLSSRLEKVERGSVPDVERTKIPSVALSENELFSADSARIDESNAPALSEGEEAFFVDNAGLILLAPFFQTFFKNLKLVENKKFTDEKAQQKAILLTQYLLTEKTQIFEHELILNKILCGYPLENTLPFDLEIPPTDQRECDELFATVVALWPAMKNTSRAVFRETFLKRKGKLSLRPGDYGTAWVLTVEPDSRDILLKARPPQWTFSLVKLPWMAQPIQTEW